MPIRPEDPRLPYLQLADQLREDIRTGRYQEGDQLPSTRRLAEDNGISTGTVQRAMKVLRQEGLIGAHQGRGAFVLESSTATEHDPATPKTLDEALEQLAEVQQRLDRLEAQAPAADAAPAPDAAPTQDTGPGPDM